MTRPIALLTVVLMLACPTPPGASEEGAAALLLDNEELCLRVGAAAPARAVRADHLVAARALARETLEIAQELLAQVPRTTGRVRLLVEVLELEQRICGGPAPAGDRKDLESELRSAARRLEAAIPLGAEQRHGALLRFLDRRDEAISISLEAAQVQEVPASTQVEPAKKRSPDGPIEAQAAVSRAPARAIPASDALGAKVAPQQVWDPSPEELARRRQQRVNAFQGRLAAWRPAYRRELQELSVLRSTLARELDARSLQHVRQLCEQLTEVVERVEYGVVLTAPEPSVRGFLDRMLAGYAAAGRWCHSGRFAFAWIEIEKADQRWRELSARLAKLDGR